jgi:hypothetical protein
MGGAPRGAIVLDRPKKPRMRALQKAQLASCDLYTVKVATTGKTVPLVVDACARQWEERFSAKSKEFLFKF